MINKNSGFLTTPVAILIAGLFIGLAVIYAVGRQTTGGAPTAVDNQPSVDAKADGMRALDNTDHIFGNANAASIEPNPNKPNAQVVACSVNSNVV